MTYRRRRARAAEATDLASRTFARRRLTVMCEVDELAHVELNLPDSCDRDASWLALYERDGESGWKATFLCQSCKKKVQHRLKIDPGAYCESIVFVKDWRTQGEKATEER